MKKLNLGCGRDIREGYVNLDSAKLPGVQVVHDIRKLPLPFKQEEFEEILCNDILEHLDDYVPAVRELRRILKPGGKLLIRVPHFTSRNNFADPTHKRLFSVSTFEFFIKGSRVNKEKGRDYYFDFYFEKIVSSRITFEKHMPIIRTIHNYIIEPLVNSSRKMQNFYESTGFSRIFPAQNIEAELVK